MRLRYAAGAPGWLAAVQKPSRYAVVADPRMQPATPLAFRSARADDVGYCLKLYFSEMERTMRELNLDLARHEASFREQWEVTQVEIIAQGNSEIGWLQSRREGDALFLAQLFVEPAFQGR